ncbi:hypothetical protein JHK82_055130 [Glycine max]|nr:hypothetical protein JHK85_055944 [Glycine max]KAG5073761.1 hypothetical protein JHK84_054992 [Glycine max]KAG5076435.1 hypothetical protein JHK82_055130 [Glycine max]
MANDDCCAKQLIDDNDEFNIAGLDNFNRTINLASCGLFVASNRIFSSRPTSLKQQEASHSFDSNNGNTSFSPPTSSSLSNWVAPNISLSSIVSSVASNPILIPINPTLFTYLIKAYVEADLPDKALETFYPILHFNCKPIHKHLNRILEVLVSHHN